MRLGATHVLKLQCLLQSIIDVFLETDLKHLFKSSFKTAIPAVDQQKRRVFDQDLGSLEYVVRVRGVGSRNM